MSYIIGQPIKICLSQYKVFDYIMAFIAQYKLHSMGAWHSPKNYGGRKVSVTTLENSREGSAATFYVLGDIDIIARPEDNLSVDRDKIIARQSAGSVAARRQGRRTATDPALCQFPDMSGQAAGACRVIGIL